MKPSKNMSTKFFFLFTAVLFSNRPSAVGRRADYCTSGFMSMDRIEAAVQGGSGAADHVLSDPVTPFTARNIQAILPYINFTCDGSILSWTFGAQWEGNSLRYTELQIWRSSGDGSYTKVGSTTVMLEEENLTQLYQYTLTSPLSFQAGDILGFFQGTRSTSQLFLLYEDVESGQPLHYVDQDSPPSQFIMENSRRSNRFHVLINVQTDPAGCDCGFVSRERMRILLGLETVGDRIFTDQRQQITPDITFTCDGLITKWIVGANWADTRSLYPELQVWRNVGNDVYHKINGTVMNIAAESATRIYEYDNFSPIPVLAGDVLGVFTPPAVSSRLRLYSERDNGPTVYYVDTGSAAESQVGIIDLQDMPSLSSTSYLPLVTVEISMSSFASSTLLLAATSSQSAASIVIDENLSSTPGPVATLATHFTATLAASTILPAQKTSGTGNTNNNVFMFVGVGVAGTLLVLITAVVIIIGILVCLRRKKSKVNITDNVAYQSSTSEVKLSPNAAYTATGDKIPNSHDQEYMYVTPDTTSSQHVNTTTSTNGECEITTATNEAYAATNISTSTNQAYEATKISTFTNQAYEATQCHRGYETLTYDYVINN